MSIINESQEEQLVVFTVGSNEFGISIYVVREIINETKVVKLPKMPSFMVGVLNLRENVIPVVDLAERLGMESEVGDKDSRKILIVELEGNLVGYLVTGVTEVLRVPSEALEQPSSALSGMGNGVIQYICKLEDRLFPVLGTDNMFETNELDKIEDVITNKIG